MEKRMKTWLSKLICFSLIIWHFLTALPAWADTEDALAAKEHFLEIWSEYLMLQEQQYAVKLWSYEYVDAFLDSGQWQDLVKARVACVTGEQCLNELEDTARAIEDLTEEEYLTLDIASMDTSYLSSTLLQLVQDLEDARKGLREQCLEGLESANVFSNSAHTLLQEYLEIDRMGIRLMSAYDCVMTNYMLLTLHKPSIAASYWDDMLLNYPALCQNRHAWLDDEESLYRLGEDLLDQYELEATERLSTHIGKVNASLDRAVDEFADGNYNEVFRISGLPDLLPAPEWFNPTTASYQSIVIHDDGSLSRPIPREALTEPTYSAYVQVELVTPSDLDTWISSVRPFCLDSWKASDDNTWYVSMPSYSIQLKLDDDGTCSILFAGEDMTFIPLSLYLYLQE